MMSLASLHEYTECPNLYSNNVVFLINVTVLSFVTVGHATEIGRVSEQLI